MPATSVSSPLSLHDALPICLLDVVRAVLVGVFDAAQDGNEPGPAVHVGRREIRPAVERPQVGRRSEEHTSELQSPCNLVCRLLLEKKKIKVNCVLDCIV